MWDMKTVLVFRSSSICVAFAMSFCSVCASAQSSTPVQKPIFSQISSKNPFDFALNAAENLPEPGQAQALKYQRSSIRDGRPEVKNVLNAPLQYRKKFRQSPQRAQTLYKTLVQKYGKPKSVRGVSHVWDIKNPDKGGRQADIVTVILKIQKNGSYELIMDRDRGENGLATWAAPRLLKEKIKPQVQHIAKAQPIVQPDND